VHGGEAHGYNTQAKVNPPLREASDLEAIRAGWRTGRSAFWPPTTRRTRDEKALAFEEAPFGLVGLETALPLYVEALITSALSTGAADRHDDRRAGGACGWTSRVWAGLRSAARRT